MAEKKAKMSLMKLDESITELQLELEKIAEEHEGEIPEEKLKALIEMHAKVPEKLKNIVSFIRYTDALAEMYEAEKKRMDAKRGTAKNTIKNIRNYIKYFMECTKIKKLNAVTANITLTEKDAIEIVKNEAGQEMIDSIPDNYCDFRLSFVAASQSEEIIKAVRSGESVQIVVTDEDGIPKILTSYWQVTKEPNKDLLLNTLKTAKEQNEQLDIPGVRLIDANYIMIR